MTISKETILSLKQGLSSLKKEIAKEDYNLASDIPKETKQLINEIRAMRSEIRRSKFTERKYAKQKEMVKPKQPRQVEYKEYLTQSEKIAKQINENFENGIS